MKKEEIIIDVREKDEYLAQHIPDSVLIPLSNFGHLAPGILSNLQAKKIILMCRGGNRAKLALAQVKQLGFNDKFEFQVFEGGIQQWKHQQRPVVSRARGRLPILRQVQIVVGLGVVTFGTLALTVDPRFVLGAIFFGAGLTFAGITGFCAMANVIALLPWNRVASAKEELCQISPSSGSCH